MATTTAATTSTTTTREKERERERERNDGNTKEKREREIKRWFILSSWRGNCWGANSGCTSYIFQLDLNWTELMMKSLRWKGRNGTPAPSLDRCQRRGRVWPTRAGRLIGWAVDVIRLNAPALASLCLKGEEGGRRRRREEALSVAKCWLEAPQSE